MENRLENLVENNFNDNFSNTEFKNEILEANNLIEKLLLEVKKEIIGQDNLIKSLIICLLSGNHILLEWVPWLAKTKTINTFSQAVNLWFKRVQFTPDLLPADLVWTEIFNFKTSNFDTIKWPIFTNFLLADEINRAPSKVQSALLEAMAEKQVTIWWETFKLEEPFMVLATQNPIEQSWTYFLPEAQLDRFLMKVNLTYIEKNSEIEMYKLQNSNSKVEINEILNKQKIKNIKEICDKIYVSDKIYDYVFQLVDSTRNPKNYGLEDIEKFIDYWVWPRWWISLVSAWKVVAMMNWREFVIPEDILSVIYDILWHRIVLNYEATAENIDSKFIINKIISKIKIA